jgi:hypothetical protein
MPDDPKDLKGGLEIPEKAEQACKQHWPRGKVIDNMNDPVVRDQLARFAKCMREHGFEMTENSPPDIRDENPRKFDTAAKTCNHVLQEQNQ